MSKAPVKTKAKGRFLIPALCNICGILLILSVIFVMAVPALPVFTDYEVFNVISGSMEPEIPVGSLVIVDPADPRTVAEGDVIAFEMNGVTITHRVVANYTFEGQFVTKGDANLQEDMNTVQYQDLIGVVRYHFDYLGDVLQYLTTVTGKIYLLIVIACGVMFEILAGRLRREV